ncbi:MAG: hypothetical protein M3Z20_15960 [Chloroflexota bacterium]|nr:hypothetical protein [Chloroflexota bacterium]
MSSDPYPSAGDTHELAAAHEILTTHGVLVGASGYDLTTLAAAVYAAGWSYRIDRAMGMPGFEAEVRLRDGVTSHRAMGWEPEVALAFALSTALAAHLALPPTLGHV